MSAWTFFHRQHSNGTPINSWTLVAYHHPNSITWRFGVWYSRRVSGNPGLYFRRMYRGAKGLNFHAGINVPLIGSLSIQTQPHMWKKPATKEQP